MRERSADRRSGAAAPVRGRMTSARRRFANASSPLRSGPSPLGAPPRDFWLPVPRGMKPVGFIPASSSRPLIEAEGGFPEPPGSCVQGNARATASRPALTMPREEHPRRTGRRNARRRQAPVKRKRRLCTARCWQAVDACIAQDSESAAKPHGHPTDMASTEMLCRLPTSALACPLTSAVQANPPHSEVRDMKVVQRDQADVQRAKGGRIPSRDSTHCSRTAHTCCRGRRPARREQAVRQAC